MKIRLAVITTHPIQYQAPIWRALALAPEIDLHVYFGSDFSIRGYKDDGFGVQFSWDVPLTEGYAHSFLSTDPHINHPAKLRFRAADLKRTLREFRPDFALINGYSPFLFYLKTILTLRSLKIPILIRSDATDEAVDRSAWKKVSRQVSLRLLYSQIRGFLAVGYNSRRHYFSHGVPASRIFSSPFNIDSELFGKQALEWAPQRARIRQDLGMLPNHMVFLFSGKLIPKKDPLVIASAFRLLAEAGRMEMALLVMGDGALREPWEAEMRSIPGLHTTFVGFQNQSDLGRFYTAADCLILPSRVEETWGLVVNEAMQFGMPVIVSSRVGCRHDLIVEGETGFVFPVGDAEALADRICKVVELLRLNRERVRDACRQRAEDYSLDKAVAGIKEAVLAISQSASARGGSQ